MKHRAKNKQQILSELLTPPHIHSKCHANVESMVDLLSGLRVSHLPKAAAAAASVESPDGLTTTPAGDGGGGATGIGGNGGNQNNDWNDDDTAKNVIAFSNDEWDTMQTVSPKASFPFACNDHTVGDDNRMSKTSPLAKILSVNRKCETYLNRSKDFRRRAHLIAKALKEEEEANGNARDEGIALQQQQQQPYSTSTSEIATSLAAKRSKDLLTQTQNEYLTRSKLQELNYRYCLGHGACPQRIEVLHRCWNQTSPELAKTLLQMGRGGSICREEKLAVERCAGDLVQAVVRSSLQP